MGVTWYACEQLERPPDPYMTDVVGDLVRQVVEQEEQLALSAWVLTDPGRRDSLHFVGKAEMNCELTAVNMRSIACDLSDIARDLGSTIG